MKPIVTVQFSGNPKTYDYLLPSHYPADCVVNPGERIVVVSKMKDDNTPSLSIATAVRMGECTDEHAATLKPFVQWIDPEQLKVAVAAYSTGGAAA